ncbi:Solute carrier family 12 member 9 [Hypsibius exemplaris]|uniref:Solute carrier family 12 member 9 n=1 Tax=Hypsibius exemplaris TaxID=2072580 RepID=A0A1W0WJF3_HYPEX|nr:Solute carrier family 12 member 9 [Hypsibius exemplaris]
MDRSTSRFQPFEINEIMLSPSSLDDSAVRSSVTSSSSSTDRLPLIQQRSLFRSLSGFVRRRRALTDSGEEPASPVRRLTTFSGVFAPVCLSMFSAILFLRLGYAVGQAGFLLTLGLFAVAYAIVTSTVFSICAISTNGAVEGGGAYYMISRALGPEFGGGIGILFFLANICSGALYVAGTVETLVNAFGKGGTYSLGLPGGGAGGTDWYSFLYGVVICLFNTCVCVVGASMFAYMSAFILAVVGVSAFVSFISFFIENHGMNITIPDSNHIAAGRNETLAWYTGISSATFHENLLPNWDVDYNIPSLTFVTAPMVFAVLFNGVTGIMSGANVAGELKNPARAIPLGTLSALATTAVVYGTLVLMIALTCSNDLLKNNYTFLQGINVWPPIVVIGVLAATLSAAMTNLMGASRVLLALARDNLFGVILRPFERTTASGNPIPAVLLSFLLMSLVLLIGSVNAIASVTSIFFLLSYFGNNLACLALELAAAPNWRPKYRFFSWHTALFGMIGCGVMMFIVSPIVTAVAFVVCLLLMVGLHIWSPDVNWGSISQALIFHQVRKYLLMLDIRKEHVKYWRPQMLLLVSNMEGVENLVDFVNDLKKGGLYVIGHVQEGSFDAFESDPLADDHPRWLEYIDRLKVKAFIELTMARTIREGIHHLVHLSGLGGMKPNTVILGFPRARMPPTLSFSSEPSSPSPELKPPCLSSEEYVMILRDILRMRKNIIIARNFRTFEKRPLLRCKTVNIDVWPLDFMKPQQVDNYDTPTLFLLQLATILQMTSQWRKKANLRVFLCHRQHTDNILRRVKTLNVLLNQLRIKGKVTPVIWDDAMQHIDRATSGGSVFAGYNGENVLSDLDPYALPEGYLSDVQRLLRFHSQSSALTFLYMPTPPLDMTKAEAYLNFLDTITALPSPAVLGK